VRLVLDGHLANAEHVRQEVDIGHDLEPVLWNSVGPKFTEKKQGQLKCIIIDFRGLFVP
jgi:hypothetical protein